MADEKIVFVKETGEESEPTGVNQVAALIVLGQISRDSLMRRTSGALRFVRWASIKSVRDAVAALEADGDGAERLLQPAPAAITPAQPTAAWYYRDDGGNERGPLDLAEMRRLLQLGFLVSRFPALTGRPYLAARILCPHAITGGPT